MQLIPACLSKHFNFKQNTLKVLVIESKDGFCKLAFRVARTVANTASLRIRSGEKKNAENGYFYLIFSFAVSFEPC